MVKLKDLLNEKSGDFFYYPLKNKHGKAKLLSRQNKPFGFYLEVKPKTRKEYTMDLPSAIKNFQKASRWFKANIGKRFLVSTKESVKEAVKLRGKSKGTISHLGMPKASKGVEKLFKIADEGYGKVGGQTVDSMSANLFKQLYNKASDDIKIKLNKKNEKQLVMIIGRMWNKFGKNVKIGSGL